MQISWLGMAYLLLFRRIGIAVPVSTRHPVFVQCCTGQIAIFIPAKGLIRHVGRAVSRVVLNRIRLTIIGHNILNFNIIGLM